MYSGFSKGYNNPMRNLGSEHQMLQLLLPD